MKLIDNIQIHDHLQTNTKRCIGQIKLLFSLELSLDITINGKHQTLSNEMVIINHSDLYQIHQGAHVIELNITLATLYKTHPDVFEGYFDASLIHSVDYLQDTILTFIQTTQATSQSNDTFFKDIVLLSFEEAFISQNTYYVATHQSESDVLTRITDYISVHQHQKITSTKVAQHFYISSSYISILFKNHIGMNFKQYLSSLKIAASIPLLIQQQLTVHAVAECSGFSSNTSYLKHFKSYVGLTPTAYRAQYEGRLKYHLELRNKDITPYLELIQSKSYSNPIHYQHINIELATQSLVERIPTTKTFITLNNFISLYQQNINALETIETSMLPNPYLLIHHTEGLTQDSIHFVMINDAIDQLFNKQFGLTVTIHTVEDFELIERLIAQFLKYKPSYLTHKTKVKFMLLFDTEHMTQKDIHLSYIKLKQKYPAIEFAVTLNGILSQTTNMTEARLMLNRLKMDYYFIDSPFLHQLSIESTSSQTAFDKISTLISSLKLPPERIAYINMTHQDLNDPTPGQKNALPTMMRPFLQFIMSDINLGYALYSHHTEDVALVNHYGLYHPLRHVYSLLRPFYDKPIAVHKQYMIAYEDDMYHLLLFNDNEKHLKPNQLHRFKIYPASDHSLMLFIQTLNASYGTIEHTLSDHLNLHAIEKEILTYLKQANRPKAEVTVVPQNQLSFDIVLEQAALKYVRISAIES